MRRIETVGDATQEDIKRWLTLQRRKESRPRQQEIKKRLESLKLKMQYNGRQT